MVGYLGLFFFDSKVINNNVTISFKEKLYERQHPESLTQLGSCLNQCLQSGHCLVMEGPNCRALAMFSSSLSTASCVTNGLPLTLACA